MPLPGLYQILNPGIRYWFSVSNDAVVGYVKPPPTKTLPNGPLKFVSGIARDFGDIAHYKLGPLHVYQLNHPSLIREVLVEIGGQIPQTEVDETRTSSRRPGTGDTRMSILDQLGGILNQYSSPNPWLQHQMALGSK
jgi:hypothetical protein